MSITYLVRASVFTLLLIASLTACKTGNDPQPMADLSDRIAGQYTLTQVNLNGKTYSAENTNVEGSSSVIRTTATTIALQLDINQRSGAGFLNGSVDDVVLTDAGNGEVDLTKDGNKVGKAGPNKLVLNVKDDKTNAIVLTLTK